MKAIVRKELEKDRYEIVEEPPYPPSRRLGWTAFRPDLLGYRANAGGEEIVLVECETHPSMRRLLSKNYSSVWFQSFLFKKGSVRRILAVPQGGLRAIDMRLRSQWDVWVIGARGPMTRIASTG